MIVLFIFCVHIFSAKENTKVEHYKIMSAYQPK